MKKLIIMLIVAGYAVASFSVSNDNVVSHFSARGSSDTLTVALTGDIMMGTTYPDTMLPRHDGALLFRDAKGVLTRVDLAVGNLEGAVCDSGKTTKEGPNSYAFRTPTTYGRWLKEAGYDFLSMANNHAHDFGIEGIVSTENVLREQGIKFAGLKGRAEGAVIERKGLKIGLCAFGHNAYTLLHTDSEMKTVGRIVDDLVRRTDIVIVSFHGGAEGQRYSHLPDSMETFFKEKRGHLRRLAHFCIDHGADIVYGHGPHVVRAAEVYRGRFIAYSLGNFCTPYGMSLKGISGYAPVIEVSTDRHGRFLHGRIHSFLQQRGTGPRHDATKAVARQIRQLSIEDVPLSEAVIDAKGNIKLK